MTTVRLIADDLTGALDSAAQFAGPAPLPVLLRPGPPWPSGSFALDLSCRDGAEADAIARTRATLPAFLGGDVAFKKVDSLLRGHWAAELAAIAAAGAFRRIVLAPAFPDQGRITAGGVQRLVGADGAATAVAAPLDLLAARGVEARAGLDGEGPGGDGTAVLLCDAASRADLAAIVAAASALPGPTLWCGSAGLAQMLALALAGCPAPVVSAAPAPHLAIVGTNHPVASAQVAAVRARHPAWLAAFDADGAAGAADIARTLAGHGRCVAVPRLPDGLPAPLAAARIAEALAGLAAGLARPATLTVVGGETFAALCSALGARQVAVAGERSPGVPASVMTDGAWAGTCCFSKSGAFGAAGWLVEHLA